MASGCHPVYRRMKRRTDTRRVGKGVEGSWLKVEVNNLKLQAADRQPSWPSGPYESRKKKRARIHGNGAEATL